MTLSDESSVDADYLPPVAAGELLWRPSAERIGNSGLDAFRQWVNGRYNEAFDDYWSLHQWSVDDVARFWEAIWDYYEIAPGQPCGQVLASKTMPGARWFAGAKLNFAEYLLRQGVIVRPVANYGLANHLRVTVGLPRENERFLAALQQVLD